VGEKNMMSLLLPCNLQYEQALCGPPMTMDPCNLQYEQALCGRPMTMDLFSSCLVWVVMF